MNIREIDRKLEKVYAEMAETFSSFQAKTGLGCLSGCGRCCLNPDIETSVLEMIPFALKAYDEGKLDEWLDKLETSDQKICHLYLAKNNEGQGSCGHYQYRPSICRMFGVAGTFTKHHEKTLSICKYIRENQPDDSQAQLNNIPSEVPMIPEWASMITSIDPELSRQRFPINLALKKALERIAFLSQYEPIL